MIHTTEKTLSEKRRREKKKEEEKKKKKKKKKKKEKKKKARGLCGIIATVTTGRWLSSFMHGFPPASHGNNSVDS